MIDTPEKMKFSILDFFSKFDQIYVVSMNQKDFLIIVRILVSRKAFPESQT